MLFGLATLDMFGVLSQPKTLLGLVFPVLTWLVGAGRGHPALAARTRPRSSSRGSSRVSPAPVVFSAVPTLFDASGELDPDANRALYKLVAGLVDGLFVAGTTGEFPALEDAERLTLFELALAEAGPDRVIAHIGAPDARHASRLAQAAAALGAERIAAITPYYLPARPDELATHYRRIRDAAPGPELYAYIFPERTGLHVPPPLFAQVAEAAGLAGAKVSGSAAADLAGYVAAAPGAADLLRQRRQPRGRDAGRRRGRDLRAQLAPTPRSTRPCAMRPGGISPRSRRGWTGSSRSGRASAGSSTRCSVRGLASSRPPG